MVANVVKRTRNSVGGAVLAAIVVIVVALIAVGAIYYYYYATHGTVSVYLEDPGGNSSVIAIYITVSSIMLHSTSGSWITVSNSTTTVQLSSLPALLASTSIPTGNYTEVRLVVSSVLVSVNTGLGTVNVSAKLPSSVLKVPIVAGGMKVSGGSKVYLVIYMGPHLTMTGNNQFILRPVISAQAYYSPPSNITS